MDGLPIAKRKYQTKAVEHVDARLTKRARVSQDHRAAAAAVAGVPADSLSVFNALASTHAEVVGPSMPQISRVGGYNTVPEATHAGGAHNSSAAAAGSVTVAAAAAAGHDGVVDAAVSVADVGVLRRTRRSSGSAIKDGAARSESDGSSRVGLALASATLAAGHADLMSVLARPAFCKDYLPVEAQLSMPVAQLKRALKSELELTAAVDDMTVSLVVKKGKFAPADADDTETVLMPLDATQRLDAALEALLGRSAEGSVPRQEPSRRRSQLCLVVTSLPALPPPFTLCPVVLGDEAWLQGNIPRRVGLEGVEHDHDASAGALAPVFYTPEQIAAAQRFIRERPSGRAAGSRH